MRTRGWGGATPASDEEASARILAAAKSAIDTQGIEVSLADVARDLGVTRQTVYRYYPSTEALLVAAAMDSANGFLDDLARHLTGITDPAAAIVEAMIFTLDLLQQDKYIRLLLTPERSGAFIASVTSDASLQLGNSMLLRYDVDWQAAGFDDADLHELNEHAMRILQSLIADPGRPPRTGDALRGYLQRWIGAAVEHRMCLR